MVECPPLLSQKQLEILEPNRVQIGVLQRVANVSRFLSQLLERWFRASFLKEAKNVLALGINRIRYEVWSAAFVDEEGRLVPGRCRVGR